MSIEAQGHFFTIYFQVMYVLCFTRPKYQVSVYRTIGPLVFSVESGNTSGPEGIRRSGRVRKKARTLEGKLNLPP